MKPARRVQGFRRPANGFFHSRFGFRCPFLIRHSSAPASACRPALPAISLARLQMSEVLVIGHRNPDTDAICSAIGYAEFKRRTGMTSAVAARCGDTNDRIDFVLQTFGMPAPRFVADVSPKVRDVMQTQGQSVRPVSTGVDAA